MDTVDRGIRSGRGTLLTAGTLVAAGGTAEIMAQVSRWAPCLGDYSAPGCGHRQDHRYDHFLPTTPWTPVGADPQYVPAAAWVPIPGSATLSGVAFVLLAAAMLLATRSVVDRDSRRTAVTAWFVMIGAVLVVGAVNVVSGATGVALDATRGIALTWVLLGQLLGIGLAVWLVGRWHADAAAWVVAGVVVVVPFRGSIPEYFLASLAYSSYDSPPFEGVPAAAALVLLGVTLVALTLRGRRARTG